MSWWEAFWRWLTPWWYNNPPKSASNISFEVQQFYQQELRSD
jgi:hypothetical protein